MMPNKLKSVKSKWQAASDHGMTSDALKRFYADKREKFGTVNNNAVVRQAHDDKQGNHEIWVVCEECGEEYDQRNGRCGICG